MATTTAPVAAVDLNLDGGSPTTETQLMKGNATMATRAGTEPARRWPRFAIILAAVVVAVALVAVYFALKPSPAPAAAPPPPVTSPATSPAATPSVSGAPTVLADGCLGGTDPIKAIRIAHETAPLTPEGAAAFLATLVRWTGQVPHNAAEHAQTGKLVWAPSLPAANRRLTVPPPGATAWVSTVEARYRITDVTGTDVTIEAVFNQTADTNGDSVEVQHVGRFTVTEINGHWALKAVGAGDQAPEPLIKELQATGLPYRGGC